MARDLSLASLRTRGSRNSLPAPAPALLEDYVEGDLDRPRERPRELPRLPSLLLRLEGREGDLDRPRLEGREGDLDRPRLEGRGGGAGDVDRVELEEGGSLDG